MKKGSRSRKLYCTKVPDNSSQRRIGCNRIAIVNATCDYDRWHGSSHLVQLSNDNFTVSFTPLPRYNYRVFYENKQRLLQRICWQ